MVLICFIIIYLVCDLHFAVYCKGGKDADPGKNDDFSEFDQEFENEGSDEDSEFGYVTTPDQEQESSQQGERNVLLLHCK